jgi:hypothetical protein
MNDGIARIGGIAIISPGAGYTSAPGRVISATRQEVLDGVARALWVALNSSRGDWEYAAQDFYRAEAMKAILACVAATKGKQL